MATQDVRPVCLSLLPSHLQAEHVRMNPPPYVETVTVAQREAARHDYDSVLILVPSLSLSLL